MTAIIVDDEKLSRRRIVGLLEEVEEIKVIGEVSDGQSAIELINSQKPDLLFLDINMKDMTGFDVLKNIKINPLPIVILVTAHERHALKAFEFEAFDFLLKPYKDSRFFSTVDKALKKTKQAFEEPDFKKKIDELLQMYAPKKVDSEQFSKRIPIRQGKKTILVETVNINYIVASGYYAEIYIDSKKYLVRESLSNLMGELDHNIFFRVHRSAIVNLNQISEILHSDFSEIDVKMKDGKVIRVSKSKKKEFQLKIGV